MAKTLHILVLLLLIICSAYSTEASFDELKQHPVSYHKFKQIFKNGLLSDKSEAGKNIFIEIKNKVKSGASVASID